jgi:uncharacterized protein YkwD
MVHRGMAAVRSARTALIVALLVGFGLTSVGVTSASASEADTIAALVNQARASKGLPGLIRNPSMDSVALQWANQMGAANSMTHNPNFASQIPSGWSSAGENVAMGHPTPSEMHTEWMNSPGHRANILGDFTDIGIAFVTVNGSTWGVENFGEYAGHASAPAPGPAPAPVAAAPVAKSPVVKAAAPATPATPAAPAAIPPAAATPTVTPTSVPAVTPSGASTSGTTAGAKRNARETRPSATPSETARSESVLLSASDSAAQKPFPIGYVIGGILVILGIGGGIYGQRMRIRGRKPPRR